MVDCIVEDVPATGRGIGHSCVEETKTNLLINTGVEDGSMWKVRWCIFALVFAAFR